MDFTNPSMNPINVVNEYRKSIQQFQKLNKNKFKKFKIDRENVSPKKHNTFSLYLYQVLIFLRDVTEIIFLSLIEIIFLLLTEIIFLLLIEIIFLSLRKLFSVFESCLIILMNNIIIKKQDNDKFS